MVGSRPVRDTPPSTIIGSNGRRTGFWLAKHNGASSALGKVIPVNHADGRVERKAAMLPAEHGLGLSKPLRADRSSTRRRARSVITAISSDVSAEARRKRT